MNQSEFDKVVDSVVQAMKDSLTKKGKEYSNGFATFVDQVANNTA